MKPVAPLAALRRSRGLTIAQVARAMNSNSPSVSDFEQGKSVVGDAYISRYATAIKQPMRTVSLSYWLAVQVFSLARLELAHKTLQGRYPKVPLHKLP
jgi:transcriptional regulator with XRE-family HTH domain